MRNEKAFSYSLRYAIEPGFHEEERFAKSKSFTRFQIETSLILGSNGITLNIFDMMGNGAIMGEGYQNILSDTREFLTFIKDFGLDVGKQKGIKVLVNTDSSYTLHTRDGRNMEELYPEENFWAGLLTSYGIANVYCLDRFHKNSILAVSGQYFRNLGKKEIQQLFDDNFVIMEGQAAYTLQEMGYGYLAGIQDASWHLQDSGFQSYEQVCDGNRYYGLSDARMSCQVYAGDFLDIRYVKEPISKTLVKSPEGKTVAYGMVQYEDRVLILPYGGFRNGFQSHLNPVRQKNYSRHS